MVGEEARKFGWRWAGWCAADAGDDDGGGGRAPLHCVSRSMPGRKAVQKPAHEGIACAGGFQGFDGKDTASRMTAVCRR